VPKARIAVARLVGWPRDGDLELGRGEPGAVGLVTAAAEHGDGRAECRGCGEITNLIQGTDWCWTCVYTDLPYIDYTGRPALAGDDQGGPPRDR
jgi:hypothetical protein